MWYSTFIYNVKYASNSLSHITSITLFYDLYHYAPCLLLLSVSLLVMVRSRQGRHLALLWFLVSAVTMIYLLMSLGFSHYGMICLPYVVVAFVLLSECKPLGMLRLKVVCVAVSAIFMIIFVNKLRFALTYNNDLIVSYGEMLDSVPSSERGSVMSYGCDAGIYVWFDINPEYRFFTFQDWAASNDSGLVGDLRKEFSEGDAKYIIFCGNPRSTLIGDIISRRYEIIKRNPSADLWLLRLR